MFVPGNNERFIANATSTAADVVCLDLEDSVAPADKAAARAMVKSALPTVARPDKYLLFVRVNGLDTGLLEDDLVAIMGPHVDGISLPKAHRPEIVLAVDHYLTALEAAAGLPRGRIRIAPWIESAEGVLKAFDICRSSSRVVAASFGSEDFTIDMHVQRTQTSKEIEWGRYAVATACAAAGVAALDAPEMEYRDLERLEDDARFVRSIGFKGKFCIHPTQVAVVNRVFQATEAELSDARRIVVAYEEAERQGRGAIGLDGAVVDRPVYVRAMALIASATTPSEGTD
ncbi:MAG: CoA ester lyase [Chloroflexi bacterium]|nr:CoA ester lyase [Chloroflexota bacterium]